MDISHGVTYGDVNKDRKISKDFNGDIEISPWRFFLEIRLKT
jgi:hypothetical protein